MALSSSAGRDRRQGNVRTVGVLAGVQCYAGGIAMLVGGYARPGRLGQGVDNTAKAADAATYRTVGVFRKSVLGGATDGAVQVEVENEGWYLFKVGSGGDGLTDADIESVVYVMDDETVGKTNPNSIRTRGGILRDLTPAGAWVKLGYA